MNDRFSEFYPVDDEAKLFQQWRLNRTCHRDPNPCWYEGCTNSHGYIFEFDGFSIRTCGIHDEVFFPDDAEDV